MSTSQHDYEQELKNTSYELFILLLSILSLINIVIFVIPLDPVVEEVTHIMDAFITLIFFGDFLFRFFTAESKSQYLIGNWGWADLLASLPFSGLKLFRIFRIIRVFHLLNRLGTRFITDQILHNRASGALYLTLFLIIIVLEFGGMAIVFAEAGTADANIATAQDGLWWAFVTITTVGYGDFYPVTDTGRLISVIVMILGVGTFGVLTGFLANGFFATELESRQGSKDFDIDRLEQLLQEQEKINSELREQFARIQEKLAKSKG